MPVRSSKAAWEGNLAKGKGTVALGSGLFRGSYTFASRFESGQGTNPDELIAAAHAGCFSMALAHSLSEAGHVPQSVNTTARVHLDRVAEGFRITLIELETEAVVPGLDEATFLQHAEATKTGCPVAQALASVKVVLKAMLR